MKMRTITPTNTDTEDNAYKDMQAKAEFFRDEDEEDIMIPARTDRNNNPAAFTTDIAQQGGLLLGTEYVVGDPFPPPSRLFTARLLGDPIALTIKVIDRIGYFTHTGAPRWVYIALPRFLWDSFTDEQKRDVIGFHYRHEGGMALVSLFPNYKICV